MQFPVARINTLTTEVYRSLATLEPEVKVVWLRGAICQQGTCHAVIDDTFVYRDGGHLSHEGSALLGKKMDLYRLVTENSAQPRVARGIAVDQGTVSPSP